MDIIEVPGPFNPDQTRHAGFKADCSPQATLTNALFHALCHMNDENFEGYMMLANGSDPLLFLKRMDADEEQYEIIPFQEALNANPDLTQALQLPFEEALNRLDQYRSYRHMSGHSPAHLRALLSDAPPMA